MMQFRSRLEPDYMAMIRNFNISQSAMEDKQRSDMSPCMFGKDQQLL